MGKKNKTKKKRIPSLQPERKTGKFNIQKPKPQYLETKPRFSFNYYVDQDKKWSFRCIIDSKQFHAFFRNLKHMSSLTWGEIKQARQFHAHEVSWSEKTIPAIVKKIEKKTEIQDLSLFQFKAFNECRIVGLFNYDCTFEIIYVDKTHVMYSPQN